MKPVLFRLLIFIILSVPTAICLFLITPFILDWYIIPNLLDRLIPIEKSATVSRLTPFSVQGALHLEHQGQPVVNMPYMHLSYSPRLIFNRNFSTLRIEYATINVTRKGNRLFLAGFEGKTNRSAKPSSFVLPVFPITLESILLKECAMVIQEAGKENIRLTLSAKITLDFAEDDQQKRVPSSITGSFLLSDTIAGKGDISITLGKIQHTAQLSLETITPSSFGLFPETAGFNLQTGPLKTQVSASLNAHTLAITELDIKGIIEQFRLTTKGFSIAGKGENSTVPFSVSASTDTLFNYAIGPVEMDAPFLKEGNLNLSGQATVRQNILATTGVLSAETTQPHVTQSDPFFLMLNYSGSFNPEKGWKAAFSTTSETSKVRLGETLQAKLSGFTLDGEIDATKTDLTGEAVLKTRPLSIISDTMTLNLSEMTLQASLSKNSQASIAALSIEIPDAHLPEKKVHCKDIRLHLPIIYPFDTNSTGKTGSLSVKQIILNNSINSYFFSTISQNKNIFSLLGSLKPDFLPESEIMIDGTVSPFLKEASLSYSMAQSPIGSSHLAEILTVPPGLGFTGLIGINGNISYRNNRVSGEMQATLNDGSLVMTENDAAIDGINCSLSLPRLPEILSDPGQRCTIKTIDAGNMHFSDTKIGFRLDGPETIFIEKLRSTWCKGLVESTSIHFSTIDKEIDTTFYCSKINFSDLLNQFGLDQAEGEGTVNGKLPVHYSKKGLQFEDGFLFSTPGTGGIVKFSNTDMLRQGFGAANAGGYLDYSMKAMEDFSYNWTKLSFTSENEELLLTMELDGKPRKPLPYEFNNGMIVKATKQQDGLQYPIRLDVNFRLPLADIFQVGQSIQSLKENM